MDRPPVLSVTCTAVTAWEVREGIGGRVLMLCDSRAEAVALAERAVSMLGRGAKVVVDEPAPPASLRRDG